MAFRKRQNYGDSKKRSLVFRGWEERCLSRAQRGFRAVKILSEAILMDTCPYTFGKTHRKYLTKSDPNANYRLRVIVMCICRVVWWGVWIVGEGGMEGRRECIGNLCTICLAVNCSFKIYFVLFILLYS